MSNNGDTERVEDALLTLMYFRVVEGLWLSPDGCRLDGGREEALDEACAMVEVEPALVSAVHDVVIEGLEKEAE